MPSDKQEYDKEYYLKNKDKRLKKNNEYYKTPEGIKSHKIGRWKSNGLIDNYEKVYQIYLDTNNCMKCQVEISGRNKHMDHCHETKLYRAVLCNSCNVGNTLDTKCSKNNKSTEIKNIYMTKYGYRFMKMTKGKTHSKQFTTLEECIDYKDKYLLEVG
tara:strand:+ start:1986 stop:2459 length:474 start_codon:yes stop_codon:yes gene_type:complete